MVDALEPPLPAVANLNQPLVLSAQYKPYHDDSAVSGSILLYPNLADPDGYFGDLNSEFTDNLQLYLQVTGPRPASNFYNQSVTPDSDRMQYERVLKAPYLVIVSALSMKQWIGKDEISKAGPYRVVVYHLPGSNA